MIGKALLEDFPSLKRKVVPPSYQINMDSFSSAAKTKEGYLSACCGVGRQPDKISMDIWNKDQG